MAAVDVGLIRRIVAGMLRPLDTRQRNSLRRANVVKSNDAGKTRLLQLKGLRGTTHSNVEHLEPFGFSSNPPVGAEVFEVKVGGNPSHPLVIVAFDRRYRLHVAAGETIVFNQWGDYVKFDKNRKITVNAAAEVDVDAPNVNVNATTKCTIASPTTEITGDVKVDGKLNVGKLFTASSNASFQKVATVGAAGQVLVTTAGSLKIAGTAVVAP